MKKNEYEGVWIGDLPPIEQVKRMIQFEKTMDEIKDGKFKCPPDYGVYKSDSSNA